MPQHYNDKFYDKLDDVLTFFGSTLNDIEEKRTTIQSTIQQANNDLQVELNTIHTFIAKTDLAKSLLVFDELITTISSSLVEESKAYSDIGEMVASDKEVLKECKEVVNTILERLEEEKRLADEWEEPLIDHLEEKIGDYNVIILDTFY